MKAHQKIRRFRRRSRTRGAAMVEAVIVLPVLITFLGLMVWTSNSYNEKLREQTETRAAVLSYGSNACQKKNVPAYPERARENVQGVSPVRIGEPTTDPGETQNGALMSVVNKAGSWLKSAVGARPDMAEAHTKGNVVGATSIHGDQKLPLSRKVQGDSYVGCNEVVYDNKWQGMGGVIVNLVSSW